MRRASSAFAAFALAAAISLIPLSETVARGGGGRSGGGHSSSGHSGAHSGGSHSGSHASGGSKASHSASVSRASSSKAGSKGASQSSHAASPSGKHTSQYSQVAARDKHGRIARSSEAKRQFQKKNPCPSTGRTSGACPGYVVDHVKPLKRGGRDDPSNMQWQTKQAAKEKDRTE